MKKYLLIAFPIVLFIGPASAQITKPVSSPKISNGIKLNLTPGIKLVKAYLFFDGGKKVSDSNIAEVNQNMNMMIQVKRFGWVERGGKVSIGASEKITSSLGKVILNEPDLFSTLTDISAEDAQYVTLKAVITSTIKTIKYFTVNFVVWDKWSTGKITGSYRFKIR